MKPDNFVTIYVLLDERSREEVSIVDFHHSDDAASKHAGTILSTNPDAEIYFGRIENVFTTKRVVQKQPLKPNGA